MADEGFLQRWSRRKAEAARAPQKEPEPAPAEAPQRAAISPAETTEPEAAAPRRAAEPEAPVDLEALPDIDSLTYESDFTVFMRKGVPPELRRRALQRLWRSNPTLANLDGLVEYGGDYTKIGTTSQVVRTAYQVGRGMLERIAAAPAEGTQPAAGSAAAGEAARQGTPSGRADEADAAVPGEEQRDDARAQQTVVGAADRQDEVARSRSQAPGAAPGRRPLPRRG